MKSTFVHYAFLSLFVFLANVSAQQIMKGTVVDVTDGRTLTVETADKTRFMVRLERIEAPDAGTEWGKISAAHLRALAFGKQIEFRLVSVDRTVNVGKVTLGGIDIGMQMLRDGAVWYLVPEQDTQPAAERSRYLEMESAARNEKRGVWSQDKVKPSWIAQAENEEAQRKADALASQAEDSRRALERQRQRERDQQNAQSMMWAEVPDAPQTGSTRAARKMISILQLKSDAKSYMDVPLEFDSVVVEISTAYFGVYSGIGERNFYAFEISDGSAFVYAYMRRGEQAEKLRAQLLQPGKNVRGRASVTLIIKSDSQDGTSSVYPEIIGYGPARATE